MAPRLASFLDLVWSHRNWPQTALSPDAPRIDIYGLYGRSRDWEASLAEQYGQEYATKHGAAKSFQMQTSDVRENWDHRIIQLLTRLVPLDGPLTSSVQGRYGRGLRIRDLLAEARHSDSSRAKLLDTYFFHFYNYAKGKVPRWRIYLNTKLSYSGTVMAFVGGMVLSNEYPGLFGAKVANPNNSRRDTIVMYLTDRNPVEMALWAIAMYQNNLFPSHQNTALYFNTDPPEMVQPVWSVDAPVGPRGVRRNLPLTGVGIGAEPPATGESFGTFRAGMIAGAIQEAYDWWRAGKGSQANAKFLFLNAVLRLFRENGIDPLDPHCQMAD